MSQFSTGEYFRKKSIEQNYQNICRIFGLGRKVAQSSRIDDFLIGECQEYDGRLGYSL